MPYESTSGCPQHAEYVCEEYAPGTALSFKPLFTHQSFGEAEEIQNLPGITASIRYSGPLWTCSWSVAHASSKLAKKEWDASAWSRFAGQLQIGLPQELSCQKCLQPAESASMATTALPGSMHLVSYFIPQDRLPVFFSGQFRVSTVRLSSCDSARRLHSGMQSLAVWMIDAASAIDNEDPKWHLLLLQAEIKHPASLSPYWVTVGYTTLFEFFTPTRKASPMSMRLAQALVLPPLHRQGHGAALLRCAHRLAESLGAYQLTVEDPADGFRRLRDAHDVALADRRMTFEVPEKIAVGDASCFKAYMRAFDTSWAEAAVKKLHITQQQCLRAAEAHGLLALATAAAASLQAAPAEGVPPNLTAAYKEWRLSVKRRTYAHDADLRSVPAELRKAHLQSSFQWDLGSYTSALQRIHGPRIASSIEQLHASA